jgi:hypothetical protein
MHAHALKIAADQAAEQLKTGNEETQLAAVLAGVVALLRHAADREEISEIEDEED